MYLRQAKNMQQFFKNKPLNAKEIHRNLLLGII